MDSTEEDAPKPTPSDSDPLIPASSADPNASSKLNKSDASKIRERLNKIRSKRAENMAASSGDEDPQRGSVQSDVATPNVKLNSDRRKMLQRMRQQSRAGSDEEGGLGTSSATLRRSLSRSSKSGRLNRSRTRRTMSGDGADIEEGATDYEGEDTEKPVQEEEDYDEIFEPLITVEPPEYIFPLSFIPKRRAVENHLQRVVIVPPTNRTVQTVTDKIYDSLSACSNNCNCCSECCDYCGQENTSKSLMLTSENRTQAKDLFYENQFLVRYQNYKYTEWLSIPRTGIPELIKLYQLIKNELSYTLSATGQRNDGSLSAAVPSSNGAVEAAGTKITTGASKFHSSSLTSDIDLDLEMGPFSRDIVMEDGFYNGKPPLLAHLLLYGEDVMPAISHFTPSDLLLSRATQRILRDLKLSLRNEYTRRTWKNMVAGGVPSTNEASHGILNSSHSAALLRRSRTSGGVHFAVEGESEPNVAAHGIGGEGALDPVTEQPDEGGNDDEDEAHEEDEDTGDSVSRRGKRRRSTPKSRITATADLISEVPSEARFLKNLDSVPMLQVLENPVMRSATQPSLPPQQMMYGGQLGQWSADHNPSERLGPLPLGWSGRRGGQRSVFRLHLHQLALTDHPLMSPEERKLVELKETYAQYRSLFEQKVLEFLTQRLLSLTSQLINMVEVPKYDYNEDELLALRGIYRDIIETLPALNELNYAVDNLTKSIYEGWREMIEIRRRQGCVNTTADLSVRRVKSNLIYGDSGDSSNDGSPSQPSLENANENLNSPRPTNSSNGTKISWKHLKTNLEKVPALMQQAQIILFSEEEDEENDAASVRSAASKPNHIADDSRQNEFSGQQSTLRQKEGQILKQAQLEKVISGVRLAVQELIDNRGIIPQFALRMTEDGVLTPENQLPPAEVKRRSQINSIRVKAVIRMNGRIITCTDYYPLHSSGLSVDFNKYFEFRVLHQPSDVALVLYTNKSESWGPIQDSLLATISVPIPGKQSGDCGSNGQLRHLGVAGNSSEKGVNMVNHQHMAHSYVPVVGWYSFSSAIPTKGLFSSWMAQPAQPDFAFRRTEGAILITAEYDVSTQETGGSNLVYEGVRTDDLAVVPVPRSTGQNVSLNRKKLSGAGTTGINDFTKENDFQILLPDFDDLDLNDPRNDYLLYLKSKRSISENKLLFRLVGSDYATPFHGVEGRSLANYIHFKECARFKLLRLRNLKPYLFQDPIPLSDNDIKNNEVYKNIFIKELHESPLSIRGGNIAEEDEIETANKLTGKESVNVAKVTSFLQRVRNSQTALTRKKKKRHLITSSVVVETDYFAPSQAQELPDIFGRKRSLRPKPKHRLAGSMQVERCDLLVQVVGAKNIPLRSEFDNVGGLSRKNTASVKLTSASMRADPSALGETTGSAGNNEITGNAAAPRLDEPVVSEYMLDEVKAKEKKRARTFVEVKFQEHSDSTTVFDGSTPMWKQTLTLPFRAPQGDFTPASLEQVRDNVYFTLFDEVIEDDSNRGGLLEGENPLRVEKRYLGSFSIPFETIYREGRIEGVFRLDTPLLNFGYDHNSSSAGRRQQTTESMFVGASAAGGGTEANEAGGETANTVEKESNIPGAHRPNSSWWFLLLDSIDYLSNAGSTLLAPKGPPDGLLYVAENIHPETHKEFSFFAADEQATYVKVLITLDPLLVSTPDITQEISVSSTVREDRTIASYARGWLSAVQQVSTHTANRKYLLFGTNSGGQNVLICRYLTPLQPPKGFESRRACVHLVANIPFMKDAQSFVGEMDLWCTCYQFWEIGAGDEEEHAVMLYNYLCFLERQDSKNSLAGGVSTGSGYPSKEAVANETVFLATGRAVPEGDTVYVLIRDNRRQSSTKGQPEDYLIINPCTGYMYSALDPNCPLRDIHTLATPYNIWANLQDDLRPSELNYDILNTSKWRPLFGSRLPPPSGGLSSIQTPIDYVHSSPGYAVEVEKAVFQAIRNNLRRWRSKRHRSTTTFHPDACSVMHELLPKLENWKRSGNPDAFVESDDHANSTVQDQETALPILQSEVKERMRNLLRTRTLKGFPVNMPFTDVDEILNKVRTWSIHEAKHPEVQFVLAVRAFPLYNNILSLWIFLGTLETNPL